MVLKSRKKVITYIVMFALMLFFFFPLLYMLSVSFNPDEMDILESMASIRAFFPGDFSLKKLF